MKTINTTNIENTVSAIYLTKSLYCAKVQLVWDNCKATLDGSEKRKNSLLKWSRDYFYRYASDKADAEGFEPEGRRFTAKQTAFIQSVKEVCRHFTEQAEEVNGLVIPTDMSLAFANFTYDRNNSPLFNEVYERIVTLLKNNVWNLKNYVSSIFDATKEITDNCAIAGAREFISNLNSKAEVIDHVFGEISANATLANQDTPATTEETPATHSETEVQAPYMKALVKVHYLHLIKNLVAVKMCLYVPEEVREYMRTWVESNAVYIRTAPYTAEGLQMVTKSMEDFDDGCRTFAEMVITLLTECSEDIYSIDECMVREEDIPHCVYDAFVTCYASDNRESHIYANTFYEDTLKGVKVSYLNFAKRIYTPRNGYESYALHRAVKEMYGSEPKSAYSSFGDCGLMLALSHAYYNLKGYLGQLPVSYDTDTMEAKECVSLHKVRAIIGAMADKCCTIYHGIEAQGTIDDKIVKGMADGLREYAVEYPDIVSSVITIMNRLAVHWDEYNLEPMTSERSEGFQTAYEVYGDDAYVQNIIVELCAQADRKMIKHLFTVLSQTLNRSHTHTVSEEYHAERTVWVLLTSKYPEVEGFDVISYIGVHSSPKETTPAPIEPLPAETDKDTTSQENTQDTLSYDCLGWQIAARDYNYISNALYHMGDEKAKAYLQQIYDEAVKNAVDGMGFGFQYIETVINGCIKCFDNAATEFEGTTEGFEMAKQFCYTLLNVTKFMAEGRSGDIPETIVNAMTAFVDYIVSIEDGNHLLSDIIWYIVELAFYGNRYNIYYETHITEILKRFDHWEDGKLHLTRLLESMELDTWECPDVYDILAGGNPRQYGTNEREDNDYGDYINIELPALNHCNAMCLYRVVFVPYMEALEESMLFMQYTQAPAWERLVNCMIAKVTNPSKHYITGKFYEYSTDKDFQMQLNKYFEEFQEKVELFSYDNEVLGWAIEAVNEFYRKCRFDEPPLTMEYSLLEELGSLYEKADNELKYLHLNASKKQREKVYEMRDLLKNPAWNFRTRLYHLATMERDLECGDFYIKAEHKEDFDPIPVKTLIEQEIDIYRQEYEEDSQVHLVDAYRYMTLLHLSIINGSSQNKKEHLDFCTNMERAIELQMVINIAGDLDEYDIKELENDILNGPPIPYSWYQSKEVIEKLEQAILCID